MLPSLYAFSLGTASSMPWCLAFIPLPALRGKALFCCSLDLVASPPVNTSLLLDSVNKESHVERKSRHELTIWISTSPPVVPPRSANKMHRIGFPKQFGHFFMDFPGQHRNEWPAKSVYLLHFMDEGEYFSTANSSLLFC